MTNSGRRPVDPEVLEPGARVGRWRVVEALGVGGQGAVYRVEDSEHPGRFYALKRARPPHGGRAEREVALMKTRAVHPHVVGFQREDGEGLLMDWVEGPALHAWAERADTTFRQLAAASATVARTLGELHGRGVLHRDLKPEHIVLRESDGQPVLLDFGVGWYEGAAPLTTGPLPPATLYLLSPEAVRFLWASPQHPGAHYAFSPGDDLYALGVCLYRAVTGHCPYPEHLSADVLQYAIVHLRVPAPRDVNPRVPRALSEVIARLVAKDPRERYPDGEAVHAALSAAMTREPERWELPIFEGQAVPPERPGDAPEWRIVRPRRPKPSWVFKSLVLGTARETSRNWGPLRLALATAALWMLMPVTVALRDAWVDAAWTTDGLGMSTEAPPPRKNQKRAPCTEKLEVEVSGACWLSLKHRPPNCPPQTLAFNDECLWPVPQPRPALPTSLDAGTPEAR